MQIKIPWIINKCNILTNDFTYSKISTVLVGIQLENKAIGITMTGAINLSNIELQIYQTDYNYQDTHYLYNGDISGYITNFSAFYPGKTLELFIRYPLIGKADNKSQYYNPILFIKIASYINKLALKIPSKLEL